MDAINKDTNTFIFEENTPITIGLANNRIANRGKISADTITYQMKTGSNESRIYLEELKISDIELVNTSPTDLLDLVSEYQGYCYLVKNLFLFHEKIIIDNHHISMDLFFDNKISHVAHGKNLVIEPIAQIAWEERPLLTVKEYIPHMVISLASHEQFFKRSSIDGVRPVYHEREMQSITPAVSREIEIYSGDENLGTLVTSEEYDTYEVEI
jgi:hypothetical protein